MRFLKALKTIFIAVICLLMYSCSQNTTTTWNNSAISEGTRDSIKAVNDKVFKALSTNDLNLFKSTWSDSLLKIVRDADQHIAIFSQSDAGKSYDILSQHYASSSSPGAIIRIQSAIDDINYNLAYQALAKESYISLLSTRTEHKLLIALVYGKYEPGWKINAYYIGQYSLAGKNALEYYKDAKRKYREGNLLGAGINMSLAEQTLKPGGNFFQYVDEKNITEFKDKVSEEINQKYTFPIFVRQVESKPTITSIAPYFTSNEVMPLVNYNTMVDLKDTISLKKENVELHKIISQVIPNIEKDFKHIHYQAQKNNSKSGNGEGMLYYGFTQEIK